MIKLDGRTEQSLHPSSPQGSWVTVDDRLQIADLIHQTDIETAVAADDVQDCLGRAEDPLPTVLSIHPATDLVTVDNRTGSHFSLDLGGI